LKLKDNLLSQESSLDQNCGKNGRVDGGANKPLSGVLSSAQVVIPEEDKVWNEK
jgi:hypothetical protein